MENLLHKLVGGEGNGLGRDTADVVQREASVQSPFDPVRIIDIRQGLLDGSVEVRNRKSNTWNWKNILQVHRMYEIDCHVKEEVCLSKKQVKSQVKHLR